MGAQLTPVPLSDSLMQPQYAMLKFMFCTTLQQNLRNYIQGQYLYINMTQLMNEWIN